MSLGKITLSIVSHGQGGLIRLLLKDLVALSFCNFDVILTINIPEDESPYQGYPFPIKIIRNAYPKGFGANHNAAFALSISEWFCVVNPDIRIRDLNLESLLSPFNNKTVAVVAPIVLSPNGIVEDNARRFPTFIRLTKRVLFNKRGADYESSVAPYFVDWVAGMFVVFRRDAYNQVGGFDDRRFYMYLEDADICRRLAKKGWQVMVNPCVKVIHAAQRASRRNLLHMRWHFVSALRYLTGF